MSGKKYKYTLLKNDDTQEILSERRQPYRPYLYVFLISICILTFANTKSDKFNEKSFYTINVDVNKSFASSTTESINSALSSSTDTTTTFSATPSSTIIPEITTIFPTQPSDSTTSSLMYEQSTVKTIPSETSSSAPVSSFISMQTQKTFPSTKSFNFSLKASTIFSTTILSSTTSSATTTTKATPVPNGHQKTSTSSNSEVTFPNISKSMKTTKFFVDTKNCHIPWVDPFTPAIKKMFKPVKYEDCSKERALVHTSFDMKSEHYVLNFNMTDEERSSISCCYKQIIRSGSGAKADKEFRLLPCAVFHQNFVVPKHIDAVIVECKSLKTKKIIQKDAFSFIQESNSTIKIAKGTASKRKLSVLLVGIDTLSSFNFRRNMPKTLKFLQGNDFFELQGYNKVGDNTFPNLLPLLAGINETQAYGQCKPTIAGGLDQCNFVWKKFKAQGYRTAFAEDLTGISTFNYKKTGFLKQPTDFYLRPLILATEKELKVQKKDGLSYCVGLKHYAEYIYDYGIDFAKRFQHEPKFGFFWTNSFSHNSYMRASSMDHKIQEYLSKMKKEGILEDAITFFFSDHGCRWGPLLNLPEGFLEERLPMFFLSLPKWFQAENPELVKALKINRNRLATPFDVHQTLKHILMISSQNDSKIEPAESCPTAQSIFYEINESRTCKDACIPEHFCTCDPYEILSTGSPEVIKITDLVVNEMNNFLQASNLSELCSTLRTEKVTEAQMKIIRQENANGLETFRIKFNAKPVAAKFQATATYDIKTHKINVVINDISRLDSYEPHSKCIDNKIAKKFCICKG